MIGNCVSRIKAGISFQGDVGAAVKFAAGAEHGRVGHVRHVNRRTTAGQQQKAQRNKPKIRFHIGVVRLMRGMLNFSG